jgi:glycosyltransferase involved in cell wall biosynthesis
MKILFDLSATQPSTEAKFHGGSEYNKFIFIEAINKGYKFDVCYNINIPLHEEIEIIIEKRGLKTIAFSTKHELKKIIVGENYDRFFSGLPYLFEDFDFQHTKFYMSILGLRELEMFSFIEQIPYRNSAFSKFKALVTEVFFKKIIYKSYNKRINTLLGIKNKHVFTISQHSLYSLINFFPQINKDEITFCYAPLNFDKPELTNLVREPYFLLVSGNRWIKNNLRAIKALDQLYSSGQLSGTKVVVLGCGNLDFKTKIKNVEKFEFKDYVSQEELERYFQNAYAFIYPTLNEGFGYPPIYAMKYGVPVLASAISSVPEVCGNAALYFNPFSISEIKNRILNCFLDEDIKIRLIKNGRARVLELERGQIPMIEKMLSILFKKD